MGPAPNPVPPPFLCCAKVGCYSEILRVLKPGGYFAGYEWCATDAYDPEDARHREVGRPRAAGAGRRRLGAALGGWGRLWAAGGGAARPGARNCGRGASLAPH
jgi:hypothetical protein